MQFGYYGKTIHRGDFVRFNLPQTFVNVWDDWLQIVLNEGETKHRDNWSSVYLSSPAYRFGLSSGIAGEPTWMGVIYPATDKVGRRFPFTLALALPPAFSPITHAQWLEPAYQSIDSLANSVLQKEFEFDTLQDTMAQLSASLEPGLDSARLPTFEAADAESRLAVLADSGNVLGKHSHTAALLDAVLRQTWFSFSVWQPARAATVAASDESESATDASGQEQATLVTGGLPLPATALALFDQDFRIPECGLLNTKAGDGAAQSALEITGDFTAAGMAAAASIAAAEDPVQDTVAESVDAAAFEYLETEKLSAETMAELSSAAKHDSTPEEALPRVEPVAERLELDEEALDDDPWDSN